MKCILSKCAWSTDGCCRTLGECGAAYALACAAEPGGYRVIARDNRTIAGLVKAGFVSTRHASDDPSHLIVIANPKAHAFAAKQGRVDQPSESAA